MGVITSYAINMPNESPSDGEKHDHMLNKQTQTLRRDPPSSLDSQGLSAGGAVGLVFALLAIVVVVLLSIFLFLRRKYGPSYTFQSFITGARPAQFQIRARNLSTPDALKYLQSKGPPKSRNQSATHTAATHSHMVSNVYPEKTPGTHSIRIGLDTKSKSSTIDIDKILPCPPPPPYCKEPTGKKLHLDRKSARSTMGSIDIDAITKQFRSIIPPTPPSPPPPNRLSISTRSSAALPSSPSPSPNEKQQTPETSSISDRVISLPSPPSPNPRNHPNPNPPEQPRNPQPRFVYSMQNSSIQTSLSHRIKSDVPPLLPRSTFAAPSSSNPVIIPPRQAYTGATNDKSSSREGIPPMRRPSHNLKG